MIFDNPDVFWCLLAVIPLLVIIGFVGWNAKKRAANLFQLDLRLLRNKHIEKYLLYLVLVVLLIFAWSTPQITFSKPLTPDKTGEIVLLVDVSGSMAARVDIESTSRLERVKEMLYSFIDDMELLGDVKISLCAFTDIATSLVPLVGKEDYSYLKESIDKILDVNSVPGTDTRIGDPILEVFDLPGLDITHQAAHESPKFIIIFSDGEVYYLDTPGVGMTEKVAINNAVKKAVEYDVKIVTVGVGEEKGARIPIFDSNGIFTGTYRNSDGTDVVSYLEEEILIDIADRTGGKYFYENELNSLSNYIETNLAVVETIGNQNVDVYQSIAVWFLLATVPVWIALASRHFIG
jgi:Ca-activated chloride channel family protein